MKELENSNINEFLESFCHNAALNSGMNQDEEGIEKMIVYEEENYGGNSSSRTGNDEHDISSLAKQVNVGITGRSSFT